MAIEIYETIAKSQVDNNLLKYSAKGNLLNAGLCRLNGVLLRCHFSSSCPVCVCLDIVWDLPYISLLHIDLAGELLVCSSMTLHCLTLSHDPALCISASCIPALCDPTSRKTVSHRIASHMICIML